MSFDPEACLKSLAALSEGEIELGQAALALAAVNQESALPERYINHLEKLCREVSARHKALLEAGADDDVHTQLAALKHILSDAHAYSGDTDAPGHIQNMNLLRVIDRGKGGHLTLSILYIHVAQAQGWHAFGIDMPGYFLCGLEKAGHKIIFDPFRACRVLEAKDLRSLVKKALGEDAELSASYYEPVANRGLLIVLQNRIKHRLIEEEDYEAALRIAENMRAIDPAEYRVLLDLGILYMRTGHAEKAVHALERYIDEAPDAPGRRDAELLLRQIREDSL